MTTIYGIKNCDTMKKAMKWLDAHGVDYTFHDYKKQGLDTGKLEQWLQQVAWEVLLNKRGTTYRKLPDELKNNLDGNTAKTIMLENLSIIKRPVLENGATLLVGFKDDDYSEHLL